MSAHLLERGLVTKSSAEYVIPNNIKDVMYKTIAYNSLKRKDRYPNGSRKSGVFQNKQTREEADSFYAIHKFDAEMTSNRVKITDIYNFDKQSGNDIVSKCINAIIRTKQRGKFKFYPVRAHLVR